jgi:hypothetical protein
MTAIKPLFTFDPEAFERILQDISKMGEIFADAMRKSGFGSLPTPTDFNWDEYLEAQRRLDEELFQTRQRQAHDLTRTAHIYGFRDSKVVWMTTPEQFAFINLDGFTCADIPPIGDNYDDALQWIRAESKGDHE